MAHKNRFAEELTEAEVIALAQSAAFKSFNRKFLIKQLVSMDLLDITNGHNQR